MQHHTDADTVTGTPYVVCGVLTAIGALFVDHYLWTVVPLSFGPGVVVGFLAPTLVGSLGVVVGIVAHRTGRDRLGYGIVLLNVFAVLFGIYWAMALTRGGLFGTV